MESRLGARIRKVRGNISQIDFSKKLDIHENTLRLYEKGKRLPDAKVLADICQIYGVSPAWLLLGEGQMKETEQGWAEFRDLRDKARADIREYLIEHLPNTRAFVEVQWREVHYIPETRAESGTHNSRTEVHLHYLLQMESGEVQFIAALIDATSQEAEDIRKAAEMEELEVLSITPDFDTLVNILLKKRIAKRVALKMIYDAKGLSKSERGKSLNDPAKSTYDQNTLASILSELFMAINQYSEACNIELAPYKIEEIISLMLQDLVASPGKALDKEKLARLIRLAG